jgi:RNA polymerase sigma factor (sigma-70 family)
VVSRRHADPLAGTERLIARVHAYVAHRLGDGPEAEDVTSEVFENALRYRKTYDPSKGEPIAWLLGIARRGVSNSLARREAHGQELPDIADGEDVEAETLTRLALDAAIASLDERDRDLVALRYGSDLKAAQIAQVLGMQRNAVEVALYRALGRLRTALDSAEFGESRAVDFSLANRGDGSGGPASGTAAQKSV